MLMCHLSCKYIAEVALFRNKKHSFTNRFISRTCQVCELTSCCGFNIFSCIFRSKNNFISWDILFHFYLFLLSLVSLCFVSLYSEPNLTYLFWMCLERGLHSFPFGTRSTQLSRISGLRAPTLSTYWRWNHYWVRDHPPLPYARVR